MERQELLGSVSPETQRKVQLHDRNINAGATFLFEPQSSEESMGMRRSRFRTPMPEDTSSHYRANAHWNLKITYVTFDHLPFRLTLEVQPRRIGGGYTRVKTIARNTWGFGAGVRSQLEHPHQVCADVRI
jgi:hypothetical protein